jgi:outer membrane lipoprotein-sorting protein
MKILRKALKILPVVLMLLPAVVFSQSKNKDASRILKEVTDKTKSYNSIKLEFTYQMENPDANINEVTQGVALVSGDKYQLDIAGQKIISNGKTIWTIIPDAEEVQVNDVSEDSEGFSITRMLNSYNQDFKSKLLPKITTMDGKNIYALDLTPIKKKAFEKVQLFIDKDKMQPYAIVIYDQNGSVYTYKITSFIENVPVEDKDFVFNEADYPDYDVIDMR